MVMEIRTSSKCDFCTTSSSPISPPMTPVWEYDIGSFIHQDEAGQTLYIWPWLACNECSQMIEDGNLKGLVDRAVKTYMEAHPIGRRAEVQVRNQLYQVFVKVLSKRKGDRKPYGRKEVKER